MQKSHFRHIIHLLRRKGLIAAFALLLFLLPSVSKAQLNYLEYVNKRVYFGITLGYNSSRFKLTHSSDFIYNDSVRTVHSVRGPGFNLGIISNLNVGKYFDLRFIPALAFGDKKLQYSMLGGSELTKSIESIYLEFPLSVRFKSQPIKDMRIYVLTGMKYSMDLASNAKARKAEEQVKITRNDIAYEYGIGFQFFFPLFIFSPEIKISQGLFNIHSRDPNLIYSNSLDKLFSRTLIFSLHFEG